MKPVRFFVVFNLRTKEPVLSTFSRFRENAMRAAENILLYDITALVTVIQVELTEVKEDKA